MWLRRLSIGNLLVLGRSVLGLVMEVIVNMRRWGN